MKNLLSEEIERFLTLSNYDTKLTFSENTKTISENRTLAATVGEVEAAMSGVRRKTLSQLIRGTTLNAPEAARLLALDARAFEKEFATAIQNDIKAGVKGTLGPLGKNMTKIEIFRKVVQETKGKGRKLTTIEMKDLAKSITEANNIKAANYKSAYSLISQYGAKFLKGMSWLALKTWVGKLGMFVGVAYVIWKLTHNGEEPPELIDGGSGAGGGGSTDTTPPNPDPGSTDTISYRPCSGTYEFGCKSSAIYAVQECLGLVTDGKFGPKTQEALSNKGYTSFTDEDVDEICRNSKNTGTSTHDDSNDIEYIDDKNPNDL